MSHIANFNDLDRKTFQVVRFGKVVVINATEGTADVQIDDAILPGLRIIASRAGANGRQWWVPAVGESVLVLNPTDNVSDAVVWGSAYYDDPDCTIPTGASSEASMILYPDGTQWSYNYVSHAWACSVKATPEDEESILSASINADQGLQIQVSKEVSATLSAEEISFSVSEDVSATLNAEKITLSAGGSTTATLSAEEISFSVGTTSFVINAEGISMSTPSGTINMEATKVNVTQA